MIVIDKTCNCTCFHYGLPWLVRSNIQIVYVVSFETSAKPLKKMTFFIIQNDFIKLLSNETRRAIPVKSTNKMANLTLESDFRWQKCE